MSLRLKRLGLLLALCLATTSIVCAQQPPGLHLEARADTDRVAPGEQLRFVITLANEGPDVLTGLVVRDVTPEGTTFFGAAAPRDWMITTPPQGRGGEVVWRSTAAFEPGARVELSMLVTVQAEGGSLVSPGCTVQADGWNEPSNGPAITVAVVAPTATPAPGRVGRAFGSPLPWLAAGGVAVGVGLAVTWGLRRRAR